MTSGDPQLPIHVLATERQLMDLDTIDERHANMAPTDHVGGRGIQRLVRQEIGTWCVESKLVNSVDSGIYAGSVELQERIGTLAVEKQRLPIQEYFCGACRPFTHGIKLARPLESDFPGVQELKLLPIRGDYFISGRVFYREALEASQILCHRAEYGLRVRIDRLLGARVRDGNQSA